MYLRSVKLGKVTWKSHYWFRVKESSEPRKICILYTSDYLQVYFKFWLWINYTTILMVQRTSSEADSCSAGSENLHPPWNQMVHYRLQKNTSLDLLLSQLNPIHFNIVLILTSPSLKVPHRWRLYRSNCETDAFHMRATYRLSHPSWFYRPSNKQWKVIRSSSISRCNSLHSVTSPLLGGWLVHLVSEWTGVWPRGWARQRLEVTLCLTLSF
jgi:hypothetical protein